MAKKSKVNIRPLADRVLIKELTQDESETTTDSGIIIPETVSKKDKGAKKGKVVAVGDGKRDDDGELIEMSVKEGDIVLFNWGDNLEVDGEEYSVVSESNILAIID